jgi:hypothetical protein
MKASANTLSALEDITAIETAGQLRRVGSQMLLALARGEIAANNVEAGAKMMDAIVASVNAETRLMMVAEDLRSKGAKIARVEQLGLTLIGDHKKEPAA